MTTDQRIENLEKGLASARRLSRCLLAAVGLALGVWILAGTFGPATAGAPAGGAAVKEVRANRFLVEDENGKVRASLDASMNAPGLTLFGENGKPSAILDGSKISRGLALFDENGKVRASLDASRNALGLTLFDEKGKVTWGTPESAPAAVTPGTK